MTIKELISKPFPKFAAHVLTAVSKMYLPSLKSAKTLGTDANGLLTSKAFETEFITASANTNIIGIHAGATLVHNGTGDVTYTLPANTTLALPIGTQFKVLQRNTGVPTIAGADGVTLLMQTGKAASPVARYTTILCEKISENQWVVTGSLASA